MKNLYYGLIMMVMLMGPVTTAKASVTIGIGLPNVSIGINLPVFPELVRVPGYPVYYAPQMDSNYFFYDGMYWVYQDDNWYASSWYNGPWGFVEPQVVPLFILRVPVRYYRQPPVYFRSWQSNAPPRWGQHWGHGWERQHRGWDRWSRSSAPAPAPLPVYQRQYSGDQYPRVEQQHRLRDQSYRYQPRDRAVREHFKQQQVDHRESAPAQRGRQEAPAVKNQRQPEPQRAAPRQQAAPPEERSQPVHEQRQQPRATQPQREQQDPRVQDREQRSRGQEQRMQDRGDSQEPRGDRGHGQNKDDDRGRGRDK